MDKSELIVPTTSSHWSLRLVDAKKPFPNHILANVTYKIVRFFYPPFAFEAVDVTHVVSNPEVNAFNVVLFLSFSFFVVFVGWKYFLKPQARTKSESEKKNNTVDLADKTTNVLMEPKWLTESKDSIFDATLGKDDKEIDDVRCRPKKDLDGGNQNDLVKQIDRAVWERPIPKKRKNP
ncbi:hypothetical protein KR032_010035 [Drosophila birchii]|nr:hypothetical protein KR032_010035 [Drosophila birchii]